MRWLVTTFLFMILAACGGGKHDDLVQFVNDAGKGMRGKVPPLPEVKPYEPFTYAAFDLPDPFKPRKLKAGAEGGSAGGIHPDMNRRKEPLEAFELEKLTMVGTLKQDNLMYALIKAPDKSLHRVKIGNHLGVNYGIITDITETQVKLTEIVEDSAGEWSEKPNSLSLVEESASTTKK